MLFLFALTFGVKIDFLTSTALNILSLLWYFDTLIKINSELQIKVIFNKNKSRA